MRLYYLDNLKSIALLLGIVFHSSIVYSRDVGYVIKSDQTSYFYDWIVHFIHSFRMPLFFYLSGFFSELLTLKKNGRIFLRERFKKLTLPFLFGVLCLAPVQVYFEIQPTGEDFGYLDFIYSKFTFSHVWFLYYLFYYFLIFSITRNLLLPWIQNSEIEFLKILFLFFSLCIPSIFTGKDFRFLGFSPFYIFYYYLFFLFGSMDYHKSDFIRLPYIYRFSFLLFPIYLYLKKIDPYYYPFRNSPDLISLRISHLMIESILSWTFIKISIFLSYKYLSKTDTLWKFLSTAGLGIYLLHNPISIALSYFLKELHIERDTAFVIQVISVTILSFLIFISLDRIPPLRKLIGSKGFQLSRRSET
ncbi:MAG: acyltransferase family protein [Leptospiraceae bacterium]|nr:acyltransferase family protein [Leptospiraceae bacterium]MCP5510621.1 acyltransferase family protein [Leptospiraceae bacterium]